LVNHIESGGWKMTKNKENFVIYVQNCNNRWVKRSV